MSSFISYSPRRLIHISHRLHCAGCTLMLLDYNVHVKMTTTRCPLRTLHAMASLRYIGPRISHRGAIGVSVVHLRRLREPCSWRRASHPANHLDGMLQQRHQIMNVAKREHRVCRSTGHSNNEQLRVQPSAKTVLSQKLVDKAVTPRQRKRQMLVESRETRTTRLLVDGTVVSRRDAATTQAPDDRRASGNANVKSVGRRDTVTTQSNSKRRHPVVKIVVRRRDAATTQTRAGTPCSGSTEYCVDAGGECTQWRSASKCHEGRKTHRWSNVGSGKEHAVPQQKEGQAALETRVGILDGAVNARWVDGTLQRCKRPVLRGTSVNAGGTATPWVSHRGYGRRPGGALVDGTVLRAVERGHCKMRASRRSGANLARHGGAHVLARRREQAGRSDDSPERKRKGWIQNADTSHIEIEFKGAAGQRNLVICCNLSVKSKGSSFMLRAQRTSVTGNEIQGMKSPAMLGHEIENTAGDEHLKLWHSTIGEVRVDDSASNHARIINESCFDSERCFAVFPSRIDSQL
ncbi:hypothetical protein GGX14DRAFT_540239 [Mycena pura]|uniref:Uncharacterized protein n=1 Tax=Mycena pura TaxID=153505 RepID=A0AAD6YMB3_9AGAR|nr:hypothetical protein GGX14DRAFT_540239 [Mycena pura]